MSPADRARAEGLPVVCYPLSAVADPERSAVAEARKLLAELEACGPSARVAVRPSLLAALADECERLSAELEARRAPGEVERRLSAALAAVTERAERAEARLAPLERVAEAARGADRGCPCLCCDQLERALDALAAAERG